jgi:hypothetical protein
MSHFADYIATDEQGNPLENVQYGLNGDNNDWKLVEYTGNSKSSPSFLTAPCFPLTDNTNPLIIPNLNKNNWLKQTSSDTKDGTIEPGVPEVIDLDNYGFTEPFIINTPSLAEVPETPVINYVVAPGYNLPVELSTKTDVYRCEFELILTTANPTDHSQLSITIPPHTIYALAYYNGDWHQPTLYPAIGPATITWDDIPFSETVPIIFSRGDPCQPPECQTFWAQLTPDNKVRFTLISYNIDYIAGFNLFVSNDNNIQNSVQINPNLITEGTTDDSQTTYTYEYTPSVNSATLYFWLQVQYDNSEVAYYGPVSVIVDMAPPLDNVSPAYPNCNDGIFTLHSYFNCDLKVNLLVVNEQHQVVRSYAWDWQRGTHQVLIDIRDEADGLYRVYYWIESRGKKYYAYGDVLKKTVR